MKKQLELDLYKGRNGGPRPGAGRPRKHSKGVSHSSREKVSYRTPLHINFKYKAFIRTNEFQIILEKAIRNASAKELNISHYTIQSNHIHLIAETESNATLESGMKSLTRTISKNFDKGPIQLGRYHLHVLKTPQEVRNALYYVLHNDVKHTGKLNRKFTKSLSNGKCWLLRSTFS